MVLYQDVSKSVQEGVLQIGNNQELPDEYARQPLFDFLVAFQNPDFSYQESIHMDWAKLESCPYDVSYSRLPLLFNFFERYNVLEGVLSYNSAKYDEDTIELILFKFKKLINSIISGPRENLKDLDILLEYEKQQTVDIEFDF